ncbi:ACT domain-containing protein ACR10-like protein [Tanacetum coccineum]
MMLFEDVVIIKEAQKEDEATVITVNCPDKTGLGCDLCRTILFFGLSIGVASTDVFGVPLEVTVLRQDSTKPVLFILVKCADFLVLSGMIRGGKMDWYRVLEF